MGAEWFENEGNLGVAEIVKLEGSFLAASLVAAVDAVLAAKAKSGAAMNEAQSTVLAVEALEREVNNGGFAKFFGSSAWNHVPFLVKSLERVGSREAVRLAKEAVSLLKIPAAAHDDPAALFSSIQSALARHEVEIRLNDLDSDFYVLEEDLPRLVWNYVKKNVEVLAA